MYDTAEEAKQKLDGSVVLFDGTPYFINKIGGGKKKVVIGGHSLPLPKMTPDFGSPLYEPILDPRWDFRTLGGRLGYSAIRAPTGITDSVFSSRVPTRHSRQGLDNKTVQVRCHSEQNGFPFEWGHLIHDEGFVNTMQGKFMSLKDVFDLLINKPKEYRSLPISRKLMLTWDMVTPPVLMYRGDKIGYTEDGEHFRLAKHKEFLREELVDIELLKIYT